MVKQISNTLEKFVEEKRTITTYQIKHWLLPSVRNLEQERNDYKELAQNLSDFIKEAVDRSVAKENTLLSSDGKPIKPELGQPITPNIYKDLFKKELK